MLTPPTSPYSLADLIGLRPKRAVFWPMPMSLPVVVEFTVNRHVIEFVDDSGLAGAMSTRSRHRSYDLYPIEDLQKLTAWLAEHREAYARQVKEQEWAKYQAEHPEWERTVVYPDEISDELRARVREADASGRPMGEWEPDVGAAKRVLSVDGIRLFGIPLYDPETHRPLLCRSAVVRVLNEHRCMGMLAADCNRRPDVFDLFPRSGGWVFLTRDEVDAIAPPLLLYTIHDDRVLAYVRLWNLDHTPCQEDEIAGFEHVERNVYRPHDWIVLAPPLYAADYDPTTGELRP